MKPGVETPGYAGRGSSRDENESAPSMNPPMPTRPATMQSSWSAFAGGFAAMLPLWAGAIPSGVAYGLAARGVGYGAVETQLMSLVVFSAAGQVGVLSILAGGASAGVAIGSVFALNAQLPLLGIAVGRQLRLTWPQRLLTAALLTDGAFGVAAGQEQRLRLATLLGAGAGMFTCWNIGTALGIVAGEAVPAPSRVGLNLVIPLSFMAILVPLVRRRAALVAAIVAGATALVLIQATPVGVAVLGAGIAGAGSGAWASTRATVAKPAQDDSPP